MDPESGSLRNPGIGSDDAKLRTLARRTHGGREARRPKAATADPDAEASAVREKRGGAPPAPEARRRAGAGDAPPERLRRQSPGVP